jgi:hypothetical protein
MSRQPSATPAAATFATVTEALSSVDTVHRSLRVSLGGRTVELDADFLARRTPDGRPAVKHGYATTAHAAQGTTCGNMLVLAIERLAPRSGREVSR